jgi:TolA-binding protein
MVVMKKFALIAPFLLLSSSCDLMTRVESKAQEINHLEDRVVALVMENRELMNEIDRLKFQVSKMETHTKYLQASLNESKSQHDRSATPSRSIASVASFAPGDEDHVKYDIYQWTPDQIQAIAKAEFKNKNYEKAAQFYQALSMNYPGHKTLDDAYLFNAGVAAYESGRYHQWTLDHLGKLVTEYPTSRYYRGAKLWMALTHLKMGERDQFFETVEEFRKKYRNTPEWKILSAHYEKIVQEFKN